MSTDCAYLGDYELDAGASFPQACYSRAVSLGGDTFDAKPDGSKCYFKRCGAFADIIFTDKYGARESHTLLTGPWRQIGSGSLGLGTDCSYLGSYEVADVSAFPDACYSLAMIAGADTFDAKPDSSKCYFKKCGTFADILFTDAYGPYDSFSVLGGSFTQITRAAEGSGTDCSYLGSYELPDLSQFPQICHWKAIALGGDTFDSKVDGSKCYFKKCGASADIIFTDKYGEYDSFTSLLGGWSQITTAEGGMGTDCSYLGDLELSDPAEDFPQACYSRGVILGADTFDARTDGSKCYFKKCGTLADIKFTDKYGASDSHTLLVEGWGQLTHAAEGIGTDCVYLGSYELTASDVFPQACYTHAIIAGGDTLDAKPDLSKCYFKKCAAFGDIKFSDKYGAYESHTLLFPRGTADWGPCDPQTCLDFHLLFTARLKGRVLPVGGAGETCDPDDSEGCFGGNARRVAYYEQQKQKAALKNESVLLVDLGDSSFGGPLYGHPDYPLGAPEATLQNFVPYDMCVFSAGDFLSRDDERSRTESAHGYANRTCDYVMANTKFNPPFEGLQQKVRKFAVKQMLNGWKVGFVGMFTHADGYGYTYGNGVVDLDSGSLLWRVLGQGMAALNVNVSKFREAIEGTQASFKNMPDYMSDIYQLTTQVPIDVLIAAEEARSTYSDVRALVLMIGELRERADQIEWLARYGPFDVILLGGAKEPREIQSEISSKRVLIAPSEGTFLGLGKLKLRFNKATGLEKWDLSPDFALDSTLWVNQTIQAKMSEFYGRIRARNANPFGTILANLTGGHRGGEDPATMNQCYYTDCSAGDYIGKAFLWKSRSMGYHADVSLYNLGGLRAPLAGTNGVVSMSDCVQTLKFQNTLHLYHILGKDLLASLSLLVVDEDRGFIGAGMRAAMYEPCWEFVNHEAPYEQLDSGPPGLSAQWEACKAAGISDINVKIIDIQVEILEHESCDDLATCGRRQWRTLEKGSTYTLVSTNFLAEKLLGFVPLGISFGTDAEALCEYIAAHDPLEVKSFKDYEKIGAVRYETPEAGWAAGNRIPAVKTSVSVIEAAPTCPDGMFLPDKALACELCPAGKQSSADQARRECDACPLGFYGNTTGIAACSPCIAGSFAGTLGSTSCKNCEPGFFSDLGAIYCNACRAGTHAPQAGSDRCSSCDLGRHSDVMAAVECTACPGGLVTRYPGSTSAQDCLCPEQTYRPAGALQESSECLPCPEGMTCELGSDWINALSDGLGPYPTLKKGYMALTLAPLQVYLCKAPEHCPGGRAGSCAPHRDHTKVACGLCERGAYESDGECLPCGGLDVMPIVLAVICGIASLGIATVVVNKDVAKQSHGSLATVVAAGLIVMSVQTLGMFSQLSIGWFEPVGTLLRFASLFSFDLAVLRFDCLMGSDAVMKYGFRQCIAPLSAPCIAVLLLLKRRWRPNINLRTEFANTVGTVFNVFFIAITLSTLNPLVCYTHPCGLTSMRSDPSLVCFESGSQHSAMVAISVVVFLVSPIPFAVAACVCTWKYPALMASNSDRAHLILQGSRFFFFRFAPQRYYYGIVVLLRSLLICVLPVIIRDDASIQVIAMCVILCTFAIIQQTLRPWRSLSNNVFDASISLSIVILLVSGGMALGLQADLAVLRLLGTAAFAAIMLLAIGNLGVSLYKLLRVVPFYSRFVCHHKAAAGAQARLLKLLLQAKTGQSVFIDSDDLQELDTLFDTVRTRVGQLVVYLTRDTLIRPWCAGEVATAHVSKRIKVIAVHTQSFVPPTEQQLKSLSSYLDLTSCNLTPYGIMNEHIEQAFRWLLGGTVPTIQLEAKHVGCKFFDSVCSAIIAGTSGSVGREVEVGTQTSSDNSHNHEPITDLPQHQGMLLISSELGNDEATASAGIVASKVRKDLYSFSSDGMLCLCDYGASDEEEIAQAVAKARGVIVMLSSGSLSSFQQLQVIVEGTGLYSSSGKPVMTPVSLPGFAFPGEDFYVRGLPSLVPSIQIDEVGHVRALFLLIAVALSTHASDDVIDAQVLTVLARVPRNVQEIAATDLEECMVKTSSLRSFIRTSRGMGDEFFNTDMREI